MNSPRQRLLVLATCIFFLAASAGTLYAAANCNPRTYGAKGDGVTKDTAAIQAAIDACERQGGGTVTLMPGTYLSAPIVL
ncbi:MAG: glycoside hydrolase family 28 protein, partial [Acidobacteriota bacterium]|nr:glycoside hydrolase family 28 protein [Acidobacteriota bacterium]